ncbi:MAG: gamma-glutamyltransferase [Candidatus Latescibacterota bacterium]|nr:gamma-glutamyltransferase [Candidatus Latescibacterota bacterium]
MAFSSHGLTHRSTATGRRGMVASAHPLASLAGVRILLEGGNAIDAAVSTAAALNVVEPYMSGIGGVGYFHIYSARNNEHKICDYVGLTPAATDLSMYDESAKQDRGPLSPLVPGSCGGWLESLRRYGTMDPADVFAPAIEYAEGGYAVSVKNCAFIKPSIADLRKYPSSATTYLIDGHAPRPGEVLVQEDLAETFRTLAAEGSEAFYNGLIADVIAAHMTDMGGLITKEDLANFQPSWIDPVGVEYRGQTVYAPPPPCQAIQYLLTLSLLDGFDIGGMGHNTANTLHTFIEAVKLACIDRIRYAAIDDPPTAGLLSAEYAADRRKLISTDSAGVHVGDTYHDDSQEGEVPSGDPYAWMKTECTTHFDTIDADGNAVACTQSLGSGFGSAMVVPGTGIVLNNFMRWFDPLPGSPNAIGPSKKNEMCMSPAQVWDNDGLRLLIGTPGSYGILQTTPQMIMNVLDHGMNVQAAIEAPRLKAGRGRLVETESRIDAEVLAELDRRGHELHHIGDWSPGVGGGQGIEIDRDSGSFMGGGDPRRDGSALGC